MTETENSPGSVVYPGSYMDRVESLWFASTDLGDGEGLITRGGIPVLNSRESMVPAIMIMAEEFCRKEKVPVTVARLHDRTEVATPVLGPNETSKMGIRQAWLLLNRDEEGREGLMGFDMNPCIECNPALLPKLFEVKEKISEALDRELFVIHLRQREELELFEPEPEDPEKEE